MKHTYWLSGLAVPFCLPQQAMAEKQPHIIFIMTDQQRGDAIVFLFDYYIEKKQ